MAGGHGRGVLALDGTGVARAVADLSVATPVVEPVDVFRSRERVVGERLPRPVPADELIECVVARIAVRAEGCDDVVLFE